MTFSIGEEAVLDFDGTGKKNCRVKITGVLDGNAYQYKYLHIHPDIRLELYGLNIHQVYTSNETWLKKIKPMVSAQEQEDADINLDIVIRALMFTALYSPDDDEAEIFLSYARELLND